MEEINLDKLDPKFKYEVAAHAGAENFKRCFACGTCTATCPVAEVNEDYDPRKIIRMALLGMRKEVLSSDIIWMCVRCYNCYARCPQNVKFADVMTVLREMQDLRCNLVKFILNPEKEQGEKVRSMLDKEISQEK
jgi:heterodisulfide reductase subunit C